MSNRVSVPISADASRAVSEMDRFTGAIRRAGQEGRKFSELDFSHPELKEFEETMADAQRRFDEIVKAGRGETAGKLRTGVSQKRFTDIVDWWEDTPKRFDDPRLRDRHRTNVLSGVFSGTDLQPQVPGQGPGGFPSAVGSGVGSMMRWALPAMGLAGAGVMGRQGLTSATDEATETSRLRRSMAALNTDFETFREQVRQAGEGLGMTYEETVKLTGSFARASGQNDENAFRDARQAMGFARSFGMDPAQTVGRFGRASWLQAGGGDADPKQIAGLFADAIAAGDMFTKGDEVIDAILSWVAASERVMVNAPNVAAYAGLQASMNRSDAPGLRGEAGAAVLSRMDSAIRGGGGAGEAGQNFLYRILSGTGVRNPFDVQYQLEEGAFAELDNGQTMFESVRDALKAQYSDPKMRASAGSRLLGLSMHQYERLEELTPADIGGTGREIGQLGLDLGDMNAESYLDVARLRRMGPKELEGYRAQLMRTRGGELSPEQRASLDTTKPEELREALIGIAARIGPEKDLGRRTLDVTVEIKNQVTRLADGLLGPIEGGKEAVGGGFRLANAAVENTSDVVSAESREERRSAVNRGWGQLLAESARSMVPFFLRPDKGEVNVKFEPLEVQHRNERGEVVARDEARPQAMRRPAQAH